MAETADRVVVDVVANLDKAGADAVAYASKFEQSAGRVGRAANDIERSSARAAYASRNLGRQIADIGTQLAGNQSPFLILAEQAPQVADALADTGGKAAKVAAFFAGPWGAAILGAGSVLGVLVSHLWESGKASTEAAKHIREFANSQLDLADYIDKATGKLIAQNRVMAQGRAAILPAQITAANIDTQGYVNQAFYAARSAIASTTDFSSKGLGAARDSLVAAINASGSNVLALFRNISAAAKDNPSNKVLQGLVVTIGQLAEKAQAGAENIGKLKNQQTQLNKLLAGGTVQTTDLIDAQVKRETATTAVAKAEQRLADVQAQKARIDAMDETPAKAKALSDYHDQLLAATNAVSTAREAEKQHAKDLSEIERQAKAAQKAYADFLKTIRNTPFDIDKMARSITPASLGLENWFPKKNEQVPTEFGSQKDRDEWFKKDAEAQWEAVRPVIEQETRAREEGIRSTADLYYRLFSGGTKGLWSEFKRLGLEALAKLAAKQTFKLLDQFFPSAASSIGSFFSGRASGGNVAPYQTVRVNEQGGGRPELLRMGGQGGQVIPLGQASAATAGRSGTTVLQTIQVDARGAVMNDQFASLILARADQAAAMRDSQVASALSAATPARIKSYQTLGS